MDSKIYTLCEEIIKEEGELFLSIYHLFELVKQEKDDFNVSYDEFIIALSSKKDLFSIIDLPLDTTMDGLDIDNSDFLKYSGPYIHLSQQEISHDEYSQFLKDKVGDIIVYLQNLYQYKMDQGGNEDEDSIKLQGILDRSYVIQEKLQSYEN